MGLWPSHFRNGHLHPLGLLEKADMYWGETFHKFLSTTAKYGPHDRTVLLGMHPEEAEEPRGRRRREWNGGTRIGMYYRR
jgi:hypothetical protein